MGRNGKAKCMSKIDPGAWDMFADISAITAWLDKTNEDNPHEDSMRVLKVGEEIAEAYEALAIISIANGKAAAAYIGMTGQNPRKGITHTETDLLMELADVAITALCAMQHFTRNADITRGMLASKIAAIISRANIAA